MVDNPLVSILCLCYNQEQFIKESLESIKNQTYKNFEIIICDDSSRDNSVEVIDAWTQNNPEILTKFVKHTENKGITKSLNEILNLSKGKYIQILALDDILMPDKFARQVAMLENAPANYTLVFSDANLIDQNSNLYQNKFLAYYLSYLSLKSENYYEMLLEKNFIPAMSILMKRVHLINENGFDEDLSFEDYDMWLRLSKKYDFLFDETISCSYRFHPNNSHKKASVMNNSTLFKIFIKHSEHKQIRKKAYEQLEKIYHNRSLVDEHKIFFSHYPVESILERIIKNNLHPKFYQLALKVKKKLKLLM